MAFSRIVTYVTFRFNLPTASYVFCFPPQKKTSTPGSVSTFQRLRGATKIGVVFFQDAQRHTWVQLQPTTHPYRSTEIVGLMIFWIFGLTISFSPLVFIFWHMFVLIETKKYPRSFLRKGYYLRDGGVDQSWKIMKLIEARVSWWFGSPESPSAWGNWVPKRVHKNWDVKTTPW